uniref:Uncharacterized protein n=1 Tax=virus sp. ctML55 TaxID=2827627 RepID=A0A8S5RIF0_9VIRU|nr:MAG TPA: hypothetical protein [virus sp. ctML55]DAV51728.1 MAG TPA: hypothetical protein [Bacteriophage sp.]
MLFVNSSIVKNFIRLYVYVFTVIYNHNYRFTKTKIGELPNLGKFSY